MRDRAHPAGIHSLIGTATRIAERMGVHRDGTALGLNVVRSEERRRIWWQLQIMDITVANLVGVIPMSLWAPWDAQMPLNLNDSDFHDDMTTLPDERSGLTDMSHSLWQFRILYTQRLQHTSGVPKRGLTWILSAEVPQKEKDDTLDAFEQELNEHFIRYCDPLNPLHVYIQVGIRQLLIEARRTVRQPGLLNAKITEMTREARDEFLAMSVKSLEYYVYSRETPSLKGFLWYTQSKFQPSAFAYVILEAHHRHAEPSVADLWRFIEKVYATHPDLTTSKHKVETVALAHITIAAWQKYESWTYEQEGPSTSFRTPDWILRLCQEYGILEQSGPFAEDAGAFLQELDASTLLPPGFDFDAFEWSMWEQPGLGNGL